MDIKPDNKFKQTLLIVIIGIMLFAALLNLSEVLGVLQYAIGLCMPLIVGGAMAFIMNVPMHFFLKNRSTGSRDGITAKALKSKDGHMHHSDPCGFVAALIS